MKRNLSHSGTLQKRNGITQTTKVLSLLLLTSIVLIASCKKDKKTTPATYVNQGEVSTLAGDGLKDEDITIGGGFRNGPVAQAKFNYPNGVAVDKDGNVYVADSYNNRIRKITKDGTVSTLAGKGNSALVNGKGEDATFNNPKGVAVDAQGNVYVADAGNNLIRKITPQGDGSVLVSTLAGTGDKSFLDKVPGTQAMFNNPAGVAVDAQGNVYVADQSNNRIRKIVPKQGGTVFVSTLAGTGDDTFLDANIATNAIFRHPSGVAVDTEGNVYVADVDNSRIRKIIKDGGVITLAGTGDKDFLDAPIGTNAKFHYPAGVAVDAQGMVYVADLYNHRIRTISKDGVVKTLAGSGFLPDPNQAHIGDFLNGKGTAARFNNPYGVAVAADGRVYVADKDNNRIRKIE